METIRSLHRESSQVLWAPAHSCPRARAASTGVKRRGCQAQLTADLEYRSNSLLNSSTFPSAAALSRDSAAFCPAAELAFTSDMISWRTSPLRSWTSVACRVHMQWLTSSTCDLGPVKLPDSRSAPRTLRASIQGLHLSGSSGLSYSARVLSLSYQWGGSRTVGNRFIVQVRSVSLCSLSE